MGGGDCGSASMMKTINIIYNNKRAPYSYDFSFLQLHGDCISETKRVDTKNPPNVAPMPRAQKSAQNGGRDHRPPL